MMLCLCGHAPNRHAPECDEPGCPCLGFAPVAEGPTYAIGIDFASGPDLSHAVLFNTATGEFMTLTNPPVSGQVDIGDVTARETNTIGGLAKKVYDPTWMDELPVFDLNEGRFTTFGQMRRDERGGKS